jgi:hypothetical protein
MRTFFLIILIVAFVAIVSVTGSVIYNHLQTKSNGIKLSVENELPVKKKTGELSAVNLEEQIFPKRLTVKGVSANSLLLVFLANERGVKDITLVVSEDPAEVSTFISPNIGAFIKKTYGAESVHDLISSLPQQITVLPESVYKLVEEQYSGYGMVTVIADTVTDPFFTIDSLCGEKSYVVCLIQSCQKNTR